ADRSSSFHRASRYFSQGQQILRLEAENLAGLAGVVSRPVATVRSTEIDDLRNELVDQIDGRLLHQCGRSTDIERIMTDRAAFERQPASHSGITHVEIGPEGAESPHRRGLLVEKLRLIAFENDGEPEADDVHRALCGETISQRFSQAL